MSEYEKRGYLLENFRLFHLRSEQHAAVDFHYHEFCKLLLLVSGRGSYVVDGQRYLLQPGDGVLIGSRRAVEMAVRNARQAPRYSLLLERLKGDLPAAPPLATTCKGTTK